MGQDRQVCKFGKVRNRLRKPPKLFISKLKSAIWETVMTNPTRSNIDQFFIGKELGSKDPGRLRPRVGTRFAAWWGFSHSFGSGHGKRFDTLRMNVVVLLSAFIVKEFDVFHWLMMLSKNLRVPLIDDTLEGHGLVRSTNVAAHNVGIWCGNGANHTRTYLIIPVLLASNNEFMYAIRSRNLAILWRAFSSKDCGISQTEGGVDSFSGG